MSLVPIRGLKSLISRDRSLFYENHELNGESLLIEGNSVMRSIYRGMPNRQDYFGGNYELYSREVHIFFERLANVNVSVLVVLFGGHYYTADHNKAISDLKQTLQDGQQIRPNNESEICVYPLWLREVFVDVLEDRGIKRVQFDFFDYISVGFIARHLKTKVLGDDNNLFIIDVEYIPYYTVTWNEVRSAKRQNPGTSKQKTIKFYYCHVFKMDKLLAYIGLRRDQIHYLPYYAAILSNGNYATDEVISRDILRTFNLIIRGPTFDMNPRNAIARWIEHNVDGNIKDLLRRIYLNQHEITDLFEGIQKLRGSYNYDSSVYLKYMRVAYKSDDRSRMIVPYFTLLPKHVFLGKFRNLAYPPLFGDLIHSGKCYLQPQVECSELPFTHAVSFDLIGKIYRILTENGQRVNIWGRDGENGISCITKETNYSLPNLCDIQTVPFFSFDTQKKRLLNALFQVPTAPFLMALPDKWKLLIMTLRYQIKEDFTAWPMVYSILLSKIVLSKVMGVLGPYKTLEEIKIENEGFERRDDSDHFPISYKLTVKELLRNLYREDCLIILEKLIGYFHMSNEVASHPENLDRRLIHRMCEFQSCLLHVNYLNDLYNRPFIRTNIAGIYNGTFIYNFTRELIINRDEETFIANLFCDVPLLVRFIITIVDFLRTKDL